MLYTLTQQDLLDQMSYNLGDYKCIMALSGWVVFWVLASLIALNTISNRL